MLNWFLIFTFTFFAIFMPQDTFLFKKGFLSIILLLNSLLFVFNLHIKKFFLINFHVCCFLPIVICVAILRNSEVYTSFAMVHFSLMPLLNIAIYKYKINFNYIFMANLIILTLIILSLFVTDYLGFININCFSITSFLHSSGEAMIGKSSNNWSIYIIFFKASPLLIFALAFMLHNNKNTSYLVFSAMLLTGTRANFFAAIILFFWMKFKKLKGYYKISCFIILFILFIYSFSDITNYFTYMFESKQASSVKKTGDIIEILDVFITQPDTIFWGTGFGNEKFYNITSSISEVSFLDLWRKIGLFNFVLFLSFIFYPIIKIYKNKETRWLAYSFALYFLIAMTNPLLYSSTAYLAYVLVYYHYIKIIKPNIIECFK